MLAAPMRLTGVFVAMAVTAYVLVRVNPVLALALAALPLAAVVLPGIVNLAGGVLFTLAFALPLTGLSIFGDPLAVGGGNVYPQDIVLVAAVAVFAMRRLAGGDGHKPRRPISLSPALGIPFALFSAVIVASTLRGHYAYGASLIGQPLRLIAYAGIALAIAGMSAERLYRWLQVALYAGTVVGMGVAVYNIATGAGMSLSTGGTRPIGITTSVLFAGTMFFALLSLRFVPDRGANVLHLVMAALGFVGTVLGFGRAVYAAAAVVLLLIFAVSASVRTATMRTLPLIAPVLILLVILVPRVAPEVVSAAYDRVAANPEEDANVRWRVENNKVVLDQVREQPVIGVGFGREATFYFDVLDDRGYRVQVRQDTGQDPHNSYVFLLAGGGILALGTFVLLIGSLAVDAVRRFRASSDEKARMLVAWAGALVFVFLVNAASGTVLGSTSNVLAIWALLVLPAAACPLVLRSARDADASRAR